MTRKRRLARKFISLEALEDRLCLSTLPVSASTTVSVAETQAHLTASYGQLPLNFEVNKGQTDHRVNFLARGAGYTAFLTHTGAVLELRQGDGGNVVAMKIVGANPASRPVGLDKQAGVSNDFVGNDPAKWHTNIANYAGAGYQNVYRGINLVYHGDQKQLEYDFVVEPGANPRAIRLAFNGTQGKSIDAQGNLVLHTSGGDVVEQAPVAYQTINGVRHSVASRFVIGRGGLVGFQVGRYEHGRALVIDPVLSLSYSTYLGGSGNDSYGRGIAVDGAGDAYVTGLTGSLGFPTSVGAFLTSGGGGFLTKFDAAGALVYSTFLGAAQPYGIAIDSAGNAYVTGITTSATNFPTMNPLQPKYGGGTYIGDAFVTKLDPTGSKLVYSTYLGGSANDCARGIAVDGAGNAYVTGSTDSTNFPTTLGSLEPVSSVGGVSFVAKLNASGSALLYSTYLATSPPNGAAGWNANGIAVDGSGNAYVTGVTLSAGFPTTPGAFQTVFAGGDLGGDEAFVTKLNATGSALVYSTFLGGARMESGYRIAVDGSGNAWVTGTTESTDFPTTAGAFQTQFGGGHSDAFVTGLNAAGTALVYSTYLGGSGNDNYSGVNPLGGIAVDSSGNVYVTGATGPNGFTNDFPTKNALQGTFGGGQYDAFLAKINPSRAGAASLVYSTYLGGSGQDLSYGIAVDGSGAAYVSGYTGSYDFPTKNAFQTGLTGPYVSAFVTKIVSQAGFLLSYPLLTATGVSHTFTVTALNADGTTNTGYRGAVHFNSSDPQAALPADYTFTAADQGVHTFSAILEAVGPQSLTATDTATASLSGTEGGITVVASAVSFSVAGFPSPVTAGAARAFIVTARDSYGNVATGYTGTVAFTSSDGQAKLPASYTFLASDRGQHNFSATLKTAGNQSLTTRDTTTWAITGSQGGITVNPAAATYPGIIAPASVTAGTAFSITVRLVDRYSNVATGYRGVVHFTSSDPTATLPADYVFTKTDNGVHVFTNGVVLRTRGNATVTVTDTIKSTITGNVTIQV